MLGASSRFPMKWFAYWRILFLVSIGMRFCFHTFTTYVKHLVQTIFIFGNSEKIFIDVYNLGQDSA